MGQAGVCCGATILLSEPGGFSEGFAVYCPTTIFFFHVFETEKHQERL